MVRQSGFEPADNLRMVPSSILRGENSRIFMVDKIQPPRSVFNIGDARHNVSNTGISPVALGKTNGITKFQKRIDWNEPPFQGREGGRGYASLRRQMLKNREVTNKI